MLHLRLHPSSLSSVRSVLLLIILSLLSALSALPLTRELKVLNRHKLNLTCKRQNLLFAIYLLKEIDKEGHQYSLLLAAAAASSEKMPSSFEINHRFFSLRGKQKLVHSDIGLDGEKESISARLPAVRRRGMASINWMQHHPLHHRTPDLLVSSRSLRRTTS